MRVDIPVGLQVFSEPVSYAAVEEDCTRLVLMLFFFVVAHKAACQTLSKAFLKSMETW